MPTLSPHEGLSGLGSGEALNAPEQHDAQAVTRSGKLARLATTVAKKVGPILAAASLLAATEGCKDNTPAPAPVTTPTPGPTPSGNAFDGNKLTCSSLGLINNPGTPAAENYRRMFVQTVVAGQPVLYEPCADSAIPGEMGKFVTADCQNNGQYRNCVVKDTYVDNSFNTVNTETRVNWLLTGHNRVESAQSAGYIFPRGLAARIGTTVTTLDPNSPVVYGQRRVTGRQQPVTPTPPTPTVKRFTPPAPEHDNAKDNEQDNRLDNLEAQVAFNTGKNVEQDRRLDNHGEILRILIDSNSRPSGNPHPTSADYDSLGRSRATK